MLSRKLGQACRSVQQPLADGWNLVRSNCDSAQWEQPLMQAYVECFSIGPYFFFFSNFMIQNYSPIYQSSLYGIKIVKAINFLQGTALAYILQIFVYGNFIFIHFHVFCNLHSNFLFNSLIT